ncbi:MAG: hypothetical protein CMR00_11475 [[Chlorobium] sp. 445]|nr:MAG: hypothetical protein CMR00_11475 [[Chlorobium] sp. 445]
MIFPITAPFVYVKMNAIKPFVALLLLRQRQVLFLPILQQKPFLILCLSYGISKRKLQLMLLLRKTLSQNSHARLFDITERNIEQKRRESKTRLSKHDK